METLVTGLSALGLLVLGALFTHLLSRSRWERQLALEERKVWAERRFAAYTKFRRIATTLSPGEELTDAERRTLETEQRRLFFDIQLIGHPEVVKAAQKLTDAFDQRREEGSVTAVHLRAVTEAVRGYVEATRSALGMDPLTWDRDR